MPDDTDALHCVLANKLIAAMNALLQETHDCDLVASAAVAAAGAFTAFNLSDGGDTAVSPAQISVVARQFEGRVRDALAGA